jgi:RNA polymerase sigma-70 factor (ECF subfamily)
MHDADLIRAVQGGDRASLTVLYRRHVAGVWRYVSARLPRDRQATEDVVSETFLAAIRTVQTFDPRHGTVYAWLLGITRNKLRDHWRRAGRGVEDAAMPADLLAESDSAGPEERAIAGEVKDAVARALDALDDEQRLVLEWKYLESLSVREIAERLGRTQRAVEAILYRARTAFRAIYAREQTRSECPGE